MNASEDILKTLAYYDIFEYPLTQTEIFFFLNNHYTQPVFSDTLYSLCADKQVFKFEEFFTLRNDRKLIEGRKKGNILAKKLLQKADGLAGFLSGFPFVRGVAVSGSLSKNFADERSDIDFFIITAEDRLWLARTFMHIFKKLTFLFGKQNLFCMNYYVDEKKLEIKEKNIYTATELVTLMPLRGIHAFRELYRANRWSREFLPNHSMKVTYTKEAEHHIFKKLIELFFNNRLGNWLDNKLMRITEKRWAKKTNRKKLNNNGNVMGMDADKHYSKPDPNGFQTKFLHKLQIETEQISKSVYVQSEERQLKFSH